MSTKDNETGSIFHKAFVTKSDDGRPFTKLVFEEYLDVVWWIRVGFLSPLCGIVCGIAPMEGFYGFAVYAVLSCLVIYTISNSVVSIDVGSFGGDFALVTEGMAQGGAIFTLTWIVVYTWLHSDVEPFYD